MIEIAQLRITKTEIRILKNKLVPDRVFSQLKTFFF